MRAAQVWAIFSINPEEQNSPSSIKMLASLISVSVTVLTVSNATRRLIITNGSCWGSNSCTSILLRNASDGCLGSSIFTIPKNYRNYTIEQGRVLVYALSLQHRLRIILLFVVCEVRWCHNEVGLHKYNMFSMKPS